MLEKAIDFILCQVALEALKIKQGPGCVVLVKVDGLLNCNLGYQFKKN
jgi:hypothetical protein